MPRTRRPLLALAALLIVLVIGYVVDAARGGGAGHDHGLATGTVAASSLPAAAQQTIALVRAGGPFPYVQDGIVFRNSEHELPAERSGYYHEFTVPTPGEADRGPRRIIAGAGEEIYCTPDHYGSFERVNPDG
ncbi:MAG: ribonuclease domain-containing protein [Mycobacteriales bacterium]